MHFTVWGRSPDRIGILKCWFLSRRGENPEKNLLEQGREPTKLNPHMTPRPGIEPEAHWWEASALSTAPSLFPEKLLTQSTGIHDVVNGFPRFSVGQW